MVLHPRSNAHLMSELFGPENCFRGQHVVSADQFDLGSLAQLMKAAELIRKVPGMFHGMLRDKILATFFTQESTRTRLSFEASMLRLGGGVISTTDASKTSSEVKGETLEDTISIISGYCDIIVLRHHRTGSAKLASEYSLVPLINGGDGRGEHPTQALVDLYTIWSQLGRLEGLRLAVVGDLLHGRTIHSLLKALSLYTGNEVTCVSDPELSLPEDLRTSLEDKGLRLTATQNLVDTVRLVDVVYVTRIQANLFEDKCKEESRAQGKNPEDVEVKKLIEEQVVEFKARTAGKYILFPELLPQLEEDEGVVWLMHPLPRNEEIPRSMDSYSGSIYIKQARENAMDIRRALLAMILGK